MVGRQVSGPPRRNFQLFDFIPLESHFQCGIPTFVVGCRELFGLVGGVEGCRGLQVAAGGQSLTLICMIAKGAEVVDEAATTEDEGQEGRP